MSSASAVKLNLAKIVSIDSLSSSIDIISIIIGWGSSFPKLLFLLRLSSGLSGRIMFPGESNLFDILNSPNL